MDTHSDKSNATPVSATPINKYQDYQTKCIQLLNDLIKPCPKVNEQSPHGKGPNPDGKVPKPNGKDPKPDDNGPKPDPDPDLKEPAKSSTVLNHNGQVGSLEELIVFLIKAPTNNDLKMKLNEVYKIFNPTARDIVSKQSDPTPPPTTPPSSA